MYRELGKAYDLLEEATLKIQELQEKYIDQAMNILIEFVGYEPELDKSGVYRCSACERKFGRGERPEFCPYCQTKIRWK